MTSSVQKTFPRSDVELVELSREGNASAFGELLSRHYHKCAILAQFVLHDRTAAFDAVQKASWKAFEHLNQYQGKSEFATWVSTIVINECKMVLRSNKRAQFVCLQPTDNDGFLKFVANTADPECDLIQREMAEVVHREVQHLPTVMREVVLLRDVEGLPWPEVASRLGVTLAAAKSRLVRARIEVRSRVARHFGRGGHDMHSIVRTPPAKSVRSNWID